MDAISMGLLRQNKKAFRGLHEFVGFDFNKPYKIYHSIGKYTVNRIIKIAECDGYNSSCSMVLLTRDSDAYNDKYNLVFIGFGGTIDVELKGYGYYNYGLDYFYCKRCFEEVRKKDSAETFVIWQDKKYICKPDEKKVDISSRFRVVDQQNGVIAYQGGGVKCRYVDEIEVIDVYGNGKKETFQTHNRPENLSDVIDKSGYFVLDHRAELKRRAALLRAERAKENFLNTDNSGKVAELAAVIAECKKKISSCFENATTSDAVNKVASLLSRWSGFGCILSSFEHFTEKVNNKSFASNADCEQMYSSIMSRVAELLEVLA